jgi:hypothetical protein
MAAKRIILLLDGTWNDQDVGAADTNIVRLQQIIAASLGRAQASAPRVAPGSDPKRKIVRGFTSEGGLENIVFYERGVGTGAFDRFKGGVFGEGLDANVRRAYKFLSYWYEEGDQVFVFGFSRGAFTARSLIGYVGSAGLLTKSLCTAENETLAWDFYRTNPNDRLPGAWVALDALVNDRDKLQIDCVAVFDTVGALGIPAPWYSLSNRDRYAFHDVQLSSITKVNLHAIAIDEHRWPFQAALWRKPRFKQFATHTEQVWFPGVHADVGGSYIDEETRLAEHPHALDDIGLDWMLKRVADYFPDFPFDPKSWKSIEPKWGLAAQHESRSLIYRPQSLSLRSIANYPVSGLPFHQLNVCWDRHADPIGEMVHISALERLGMKVLIDGREGQYRPRNLMQVLDAVEATYTPDAPSKGPDIHVVGWAGRELAPALSENRAHIRKCIADARQRLA